MTAPPAAPEPPRDIASGKLVVVIDDDALVLQGMSGLLRNWGCRVVAAGTLEVALAGLDGGRQVPDLIISDCNLLDGRTGIEAIERLRDACAAPIPAFLISGDIGPERLREAQATGHHLLHKPVPPIRLRALVNQLLHQRAAEASG